MATRKPGTILGNAFKCDTVDKALLALRHELIKEDARLVKRGESNLYRLGHYLTAYEKCGRDNPQSLRELLANVKFNFCEGFGPREKVVRAIIECIAEGTKS